MNSFYYDIFLTLFTFALMAVLSYRAMKSRKVHNDEGPEDGGIGFENSPKIDLPPGIVWPSDAPVEKVQREEILA